MMIKLIYTILLRLKIFGPVTANGPQDDPLSHPALRAMDADELADLPFASMRRHRPC